MYVSMIFFLRDLDNPYRQTKYPPIYITYLFAELCVHQMYHVYDNLHLVYGSIHSQY